MTKFNLSQQEQLFEYTKIYHFFSEETNEIINNFRSFCDVNLYKNFNKIRINNADFLIYYV